MQQGTTHDVISIARGMRQFCHFVGRERGNLFALRSTVFAKHLRSGSIVISDIGDLGKILDTPVDAGKVLIASGGIVRGSQLVELRQPAACLFLEVVLDQAAGRPPQTDINSEIDRDRAQQHQTKESADKTLSTHPGDKMTPFRQRRQQAGQNRDRRFQVTSHAPCLARTGG